MQDTAADSPTPPTRKPRTQALRCGLAWLLLLAGGSSSLHALAPSRPAPGERSMPAVDERETELDALVQRLSALGPGTVAGVVKVIAGQAPTRGEEGLHTLGALGEAEVQRVLHVLEPLRHETIADGLEACARTSRQDGTTIGIVRVLERYGTGADLPLVARAVQAEMDADSADPGLEAALRRAAAHILERDADAYRWLSNVILGAGPDVAVTLVLATGDAGSERGVAELGLVLGWDEELDAVALRQIGRLAKACILPVAPGVKASVRRLLHAGDVALCREAAITCGRLEDFDAVEELIELLEHPDPDMRQAAFWSLSRLSGLSLPADPTRWNTWLWMEQRWLAATAPALARDLGERDAARVVHALNELSRRRYRRDTLARWMETALRDPRGSIRKLACTALARLGSREPLPALVEILDDPEDAVALEAWAALRSITGRNLPPDPQVWAVLCAPGGGSSPPRER